MRFSHVLLATLVCALSVLEVSLGQSQDQFAEISDEEILKWVPPAGYNQRFPYHLSGFDYEGSEVWIVDIGKWDIRDISEAGGDQVEDFKKYVQQMYTRGSAKHRQTDSGKYSVVIIDMDGYNLEKATHLPGTMVTLNVLKGFEKFVRSGGGYKSGIIVNANYLFETFWRVGKPLLGRISEFIDVHGTNVSKWAPRLLKLIPGDQLPEKFGGNKGHKYIQTFG